MRTLAYTAQADVTDTMSISFPNQRLGPSTGSKIPSVLYYDQEGNVIAVGAEALREGIEFEALENDWVKAEW